MYKFALIFFLSIYCVFLSHKVNAQGCMVNSSIFSNPAPVAFGLNTPGDLKLYTIPGQFTNNCITGSISNTTSCYVCEQGGQVTSITNIGGYQVTCNKMTNLLGLGPYYAATPGVYYSSFVLQCDFDNDSLLLIASAAVLGFIVIRKNIILKLI